jgi:hypothetical protein
MGLSAGGRVWVALGGRQGGGGGVVAALCKQQNAGVLLDQDPGAVGWAACWFLRCFARSTD